MWQSNSPLVGLVPSCRKSFTDNSWRCSKRGDWGILGPRGGRTLCHRYVIFQSDLHMDLNSGHWSITHLMRLRGNQPPSAMLIGRAPTPAAICRFKWEGGPRTRNRNEQNTWPWFLTYIWQMNNHYRRSFCVRVRLCGCVDQPPHLSRQWHRKQEAKRLKEAHESCSVCWLG